MLTATTEVKKDLCLSSFFSLHRPISLTTTVPPPTTDESFHALFEGRSVQDPWRHGNSAEGRPEDIVITLSNTIEMLENNAANAENEGMRWEVVNESQSNGGDAATKHLDGAPRVKSLDELVANFRPFRAPPPPEPFDEAYALKMAGKKASAKARKPKQKVYMTEIRVTESTHDNGQKTWSASSSPIVRLPDPPTHDISLPAARSHTQRQTFLDRKRRRQQMWARAQQERGLVAESEGATLGFVRRAPSMGRMEKLKMWMISVKRQRKLKMKKHKHKKLMKRTRNLRRRLGRT